MGAEQLTALKSGKSIEKPIYNHVNGTLDTPETVEPTPIVIIEGLHPLADSKVRDLLDFTIYLDISDDIKFAWKIQRDMAERGWTLEQVKESIEQRKPDFSAYVAPQMEFSDVVISVLPSEISKEEVGKHLKVKCIQRTDKPGFSPAYICSPDATVSVTPITDYVNVEKILSNTGSTTAGELANDMIKVGPNSPGSMDGTGLFQTLTAYKLKEFYDATVGNK